MLNKTFGYIYKKSVLKIAQKANTVLSSKIPKYDLKKKHIENAKLLPNRLELLKLLPKNAIVAELGVDQGDFTELIVKTCLPQKIHIIDFWGSKRYNQEKRNKVETRFKKQIEDKSVEINLGLSTSVVTQFQDYYFDWIYIDTDHSYTTTINELELYSKKVKPGGIIAGHDYIVGNWNSLARYGVIEAVHEFCVKNDWEILYLTTELSTFPSFAIRALSK